MKGKAILLAVSVLAAAAPNAVAQPGDAGRTAASVSVTAVDFDIAATKDGEPVIDLTASDVVLEVNGQRVLLDYFSRMDTRRPAESLRLTVGAGSSEDLVSRLLFLVVDEDHLAFTDRARAYDGARAMLGQLSPSDRVGAAVLEDLRFRVLAPVGSTPETAMASDHTPFRRETPRRESRGLL